MYFTYSIDTDIDWVDLADDIRHEYYVVDNLRPSHGYKFRVLACNKFGWSIPSIPSAIAMTPSSGASKADFYDALQVLQVSMDSVLNLRVIGCLECNIFRYEIFTGIFRFIYSFIGTGGYQFGC